MWQPDPHWTRLSAGAGSEGVWSTTWQHRPCVVKRLTAPGPDDPSYLHDPGHVAYWRRSADVAESGIVADTPGVRALPALRVVADEEGVTLWEAHVRHAPTSSVFLAGALGRFASSQLAEVPWLAHAHLADRLAFSQERGGWPTLARTTLADIADLLWERRSHYLAAVAALPQVPTHGDPTEANLAGRADDGRVLGIDWDALGVAPLGFDVGYLSLSAREDFGVLLTAYAEAAGRAVDEAWLGAAVMATYTAFTRAEWALARAAAGPGALAGKFNHPSVAPSLRTLQRVAPVVEELLAR